MKNLWTVYENIILNAIGEENAILANFLKWFLFVFIIVLVIVGCFGVVKFMAWSDSVEVAVEKPPTPIESPVEDELPIQYEPSIEVEQPPVVARKSSFAFDFITAFFSVIQLMVAIWSLLWCRVFLEMVVVVFNISNTLKDVLYSAQRGPTPVPTISVRSRKSQKLKFTDFFTFEKYITPMIVQATWIFAIIMALAWLCVWFASIIAISLV